MRAAVTADRIIEAGGTILDAPMDVMDQGRMAIARGPVGAPFGLWHGRAHIGAEIVNEPGSWTRNDLITADPEPARAFYRKLFGYTLDLNEDLPDSDFTFLRRPDGHEIGGVIGQPDAPGARWITTFEVADADATVERARAAGGTCEKAEDMAYGRAATIVDRSVPSSP